jgi:tRNA (guanine37-N1)-methyltransferase
MKPGIRIDVLTLFPGMFQGPMTESMMWKARDRGLLDLRLHDIRDYSTDKHRSVDDTPYGGGGGMVLRADVVVPAVEDVISDNPQTPVILMSPQGRLLTHTVAVELAQHDRLAILCGHYEGVDERVRELVVTDEISIGDYVLTGGELAAMVVIDAVVRHVPGVLGAEGAQHRDSHADGLLEGPQYTRPQVYRGLEVPQVLQQGNHGEIARWRRVESLRRTWQKRPDLLLKASLTEEEKHLLGDFANEDAGTLGSSS